MHLSRLRCHARSRHSKQLGMFRKPGATHLRQSCLENSHSPHWQFQVFRVEPEPYTSAPTQLTGCPMDAAGTLANPGLWDTLISRVLPQLTAGALGCLRGTCTSLRDLLDNDVSHPVWAAAARHLLPVSPPAFLSLQQPRQQQGPQQQHAPPTSSSSTSIQTQLRQQAALAWKLKQPGNVKYWPARSLLEMETDCLKWSPCSRWVAAVQMTRGHWWISVWDTLKHSQSCVKPDPDQQIVHMEWLHQSGWLLYLTGYTNHVTKRTKRVLATSNVLTGQQQKTMVDACGGAQGSEAVRRCIACGHDVVAWVLPGATGSDADLQGGRVALLELPSLQQYAMLKGSLPGYDCVANMTGESSLELLTKAD
ncbi:hypothetical protein WJX74_006139 [Apatococcus lobatus]|uniref:F-box domain-containing protein n=1 Tax=Apatococcus lobatus TaxID=904363 RepID=A0AAW1QC49_9CHLO